MTIRLLLADDQALVRGALSALLSLEPDLEVVAEVGAGDQVLDAVREHRPDVALLDVEPPGATDSLVAGESPLTARETDVLREARAGAPVAAIAGALFLSEGTVRNHLSSAIGKTGATNRAEAVLTADGNGWL